MSKFSTHCFRDFKRFIGELTANAAGSYVAACFAGDNLPSLNDPWSEIAKTYNIKVNGVETKRILESSCRLNMVSLYSGFDLYLASLRLEFKVLTKKQWAREDKDSPFDEIKKNLGSAKITAAHAVADAFIDVIEYYRIFRNSVAHPSPKNKKKAHEVFKKLESSRDIIRNHYQMQSAPNAPENINFHDVKLFARIMLDLLPTFDRLMDPGNQRLLELIPLEKWTLLKDSRKKNARIGFLVNTYGLERKRAEVIVDLLA